ncbi:diguanylate cyclase [Clostridium sp. C2-6-12]|uniref:GGDEF domain-containing response regulator n=1 Tax=Clostridium sp. C2-6-12 TaxID=2698832 RepID=UPI00137098D6|nr:diguanylate cyclase [Clostridium sp. C2-6-12]
MIKIDNKQVKILLIDDTPVNLEIAGKILEQEGYDIYIAESGYTALSLIKYIDFDLILLDIMMPEMDGFETYKKMKEHENFNDAPVIFLTAKVDIESVVNGFELGAVDYIRKPFYGLELKARVRTHVELKKMREELEEKNKKLSSAYGKLEVIATTDPLTSLSNRREVTKKLNEEQIRFQHNNTPFSIIIADIDYFKNVNDTYGHNSGDYILKTLAQILKNSCRKQDIISRWGGEEFLLLLPGTNAYGATVLAEKLRSKIENTTFDTGEYKIKVTLTFGINVYDKSQNIDTLISKADSALYEGKQRGRNCVVIYDKLDLI